MNPPMGEIPALSPILVRRLQTVGVVDDSLMPPLRLARDSGVQVAPLSARTAKTEVLLIYIRQDCGKSRHY